MVQYINILDPLEEIVQQSVLYTPSAFNIQSGRAVLLVGSHNHKAGASSGSSILRALAMIVRLDVVFTTGV